MKLAWSVLLLSIVASTSLSYADDVVTVRVPDSSRTVRVTGTILDYNAQRLLLQRAGNREETIESNRVVDIQTTLVPPHSAADELFAQRNYEQAAESYRSAERDEKRSWVDCRIQAQLVWCSRNQGNLDEAWMHFSDLLRLDPTLRFFEAAPVLWLTQPLPPSSERLARSLLDQPSPAASPHLEIAKLVAASWLLPTSHRAAAMKCLGELRQHTDPRIAWWAEAQLWRAEIVTVAPDKVSQWRERVQRMPEELRAGPSYVLGQALARANEHEDAALSFLRSPILHPHDARLNPDALLAAGQELERMGSANEAAGLYREIVAEYPTSPAVEVARQRLEKLPKP